MLGPLLEQVVQPALDLLTHDTYAGLAVFGVPGPDRYSSAQALTSPTPGGVEARAPAVGASVDDVLQLSLRNDRTLPVSLALALLSNLAATQAPGGTVGTRTRTRTCGTRRPRAARSGAGA